MQDTKAHSLVLNPERPDRVDRATRKKRPEKKVLALTEVSVPGSLNDISAAAQIISEEKAMHASTSDETLQVSQKALETEDGTAEADSVAAAERVLDETLEATFV